MDREFEDLASVADLDLGLVSLVAAACTRSSTISPEKFLQYVELAEFDGDRLRLRKAALLLFAKNPNKWHPRSRVRILRVNGTEERPAPDYNVHEIADIRAIFSSWRNKAGRLSGLHSARHGIPPTDCLKHW
jgi:ATP-dependent DNA helicase RecG